MQRFQDIAIDTEGNAQENATVTVRVAASPVNTGALATIYSDNGVTPKANPFTTDAIGEISFYAANGRYDIQIEKTGLIDRTVADYALADYAVILERLTASGTPLQPADFALGAGWGSSAAISAVRGTDSAWQITITAGGSGFALDPPITLTFKDGPWTNVPVCIAKIIGGTGQIYDFDCAPTSTQLVATYLGTPEDGKTYIVAGFAVWRV